MRFLMILIFIDLFFITTGQICSQGACSLTSILFNAVLDLNNFSFTQFFTDLIGNASSIFSSTTGLMSLFIGGSVLVGSIFGSKSDLLTVLPVTAALALLASDFVFIASYLLSINVILATFVMAPITIMYGIVVIDWWRGKD